MQRRTLDIPVLHIDMNLIIEFPVLLPHTPQVFWGGTGCAAGQEKRNALGTLLRKRKTRPHPG
jgi:hypothetical protein